MRLEELDSGLKNQLCSFFANVFFDENIYYKKLALTNKDLEIIYGSMLEIFFRYRKNKVIGFRDKSGNIISAGVLASPDWSPNVLNVLAKQLSMFLRLGPKKAYRVALYLYGLPPANIPETWHLILLATSREHRNSGLATQILDHIASNAADTQGVYLEALKNSPAQEFYIRHGFRIFNNEYTENFCIMYMPAPNEFRQAA